MSRTFHCYRGIFLLLISVTSIIAILIGALGASISGSLGDGNPIDGTVTRIKAYYKKGGLNERQKAFTDRIFHHTYDG
jgi:hypothetical protein